MCLLCLLQILVGNGPAKLSELRKLTTERCVRFGDTSEVHLRLLLILHMDTKVCHLIHQFDTSTTINGG